MDCPFCGSTETEDGAVNASGLGTHKCNACGSVWTDEPPPTLVPEMPEAVVVEEEEEDDDDDEPSPLSDESPTQKAIFPSLSRSKN